MTRIAMFLAGVCACVPAGHAASALENLRALNLPTVDGVVPVIYSPAAKARAGRYRLTLETAHGWYQTQLGIHVPVTLAVLDKQDWERVTSAPYPMPHCRPGLVALPSRMEDFPGFGEMKIDADILAQTISFHETGHLFAAKEGIRSGNSWVNELVANIFAQEYIQRHQPDLRNYLPHSLADSPAPRYTSLEDLDYLYDGVPFSNYGWFQFQLNSLAAFVAQKRDLRQAVKQLKIAFPAEKIEYLPLPEVLRRMETVAAGFTERLGQLSGPSTITKIKESRCGDAAPREGMTTFLVIDNRTASEMVVSQIGKTQVRVAPGRWRRLQVGAGEQLKLSNGRCLTASSEPTLAMIEKP